MNFLTKSRSAASARLSHLLLLGCLGITAAASGCATENKVTKGPHFTLSHPDFWKVDQVATKDGEATKLTIGKYSETVVSEGVGATGASNYESSQADVDARIFTWKGVEDAGNATGKVVAQLRQMSDLGMDRQGIIPSDKEGCGDQFTRKYTMFKETREPVNLLSKPGFRTIVVAAKTNDVLYGVLARVPYEQDGGLYCHNLKNMQTQLGLLLEGLTVDAPAAAAPAAPAASAAPAAEAAPAATGEAPKPETPATPPK